MGILFDEYLAVLIILLGLLSYLIVSAYGKTAGAFSKFHAIRCLKKKLRDFTPQEIEHAIRYYIWPECQSIDPAQSQESIHTVAIRKSLRTTVEKMLNQETIHRHFILLADSGMGKTSFLLNYFAGYLRHWCRPFKMELISLGSSGLENRIKSIPLLTYIDDLINSGKSFKNCYQIYAEILDAWLEREKRMFANIKNLREFLYKLAVELYIKRKTRGSERIPLKEIEPIASRFRINLKKWRLSRHCLLNRDKEGNYKFVHRSILEFLFVQRVLENNQEALQVPTKDWTEQVKSFLLDGLDRRPWRFPAYFVPFKRKSWQMGEKGKTVEIKPFEISIYPITNREYEEFDPLHRNKRNEYSDKDDQPVVNITWEEADRYCRWLSEKTGDYYRLPQEVEWEFVASGGGQRKYPWGDEKPSKELANYIDSKIMKTKPVNSYSLGMTPEGIFNMAGNVWEWCDDWYNKKQQFRVIRGGSFFDLEHYLHCVYRIGANFNEYTNYIGFRVVRDIKS